MSNEYLPLARLIEQGLQEGTVLEIESGDRLRWDGNGLDWVEGSYSPDYPFSHRYRIVSNPPKKITFEAIVCWNRDHDRNSVLLPVDNHKFKDNDDVIVTVEEKR